MKVVEEDSFLDRRLFARDALRGKRIGEERMRKRGKWRNQEEDFLSGMMMENHFQRLISILLVDGVESSVGTGVLNEFRLNCSW